MTDIDKAVELARVFVSGLGEDGEPSPNRPMGPLDQVRLARAVLAMAPVVTLARMQATARDALLTSLRAGETAPDDEDAWSCAAHHTETAVRTLDAEARRG